MSMSSAHWVMPTGAEVLEAGASHVRAVVQPVSRVRVRWGRVAGVMIVVALVAVVAGAMLGTARAGDVPASRATGDGAVVVSADAALGEHIVAPGDTLWQLAVSIDPGADPRETVDRIMRLNGLTQAEVEVGRVLLVPR